MYCVNVKCENCPCLTISLLLPLPGANIVSLAFFNMYFKFNVDAIEYYVICTACWTARNVNTFLSPVVICEE